MSASSISADEFSAVMMRLGPFEKNPVVAVGVSGGADSIALLHLVAEWTKAQGGKVLALTVDHNIRAESVDEAKQVGTWCAALDIDHIILKWSNPDPSGSALQQSARDARYALLEEAAAARDILHLAIAHHEDDQAETVLLRLAKGSGPDGLAGMSAIVHKTQIRVLRPLLGFTKTQMQATCRARGQEWIEDPSNHSPRFARPRLRAACDVLAEEGLTPHHLALTAAASGKTRAALERAAAGLLGHRARIMPQGYAELMLADDDSEVQRRALAELVQMIGGGDYQVNAAALDEILQNLHHRSTLGSCLIERLENKLFIIRENRNIEPDQIVEPGQNGRWDRFKIWTIVPCTVGALGNDLPKDAITTLPRTILANQPAFRQQDFVMAIPTIGYYAELGLIDACKAWFSPKVAAGRADFAIV